jgi:AcrR family transcriptional regulator
MERTAPARPLFEERESAILTAARELFQREDWELVTIDEIAAKAQIGKGTVYKHVASKDELYARLAMEIDRRLLARIEAIDDAAPPLDQLAAYIAAFWQLADLPPEERNLMQYCGRVSFRRRLPVPMRANWGMTEQQLRDRLLAILRAGVSADLIEPRPDDLLLFGVQSALHGAVRLAWRSGSGSGRPERAGELIRFILTGIATKQGRKHLKKGLALSA